MNGLGWLQFEDNIKKKKQVKNMKEKVGKLVASYPRVIPCQVV